MRESISVVIPVYNGAATVPALIDRLRLVLQTVTSQYEIILVNDGSRDRSWATIEQLALRHPEIIGIDLMRNYGQHNALLCGIRRSRFDVIVTLDDDLQQPPEEIPQFWERLKDPRTSREFWPIVRRMRDRRDVPFLLDALPELALDGQSAVIVALQQIGDARAVPALQALAADKSSLLTPIAEQAVESGARRIVNLVHAVSKIVWLCSRMNWGTYQLPRPPLPVVPEPFQPQKV